MPLKWTMETDRAGKMIGGVSSSDMSPHPRSKGLDPP